MDLTVGTTVLVLETTVHPTNMDLQTLQTTGDSPVTTALETTIIPPPRLETMGAILALGLETMVQELAATALEVMAPRPEAMAQEVITIPLPRLEVTDPKVETMAVIPVVIPATMLLGLEAMDLEMTQGLEVMALDLVTTALEAMALNLETLVAIMVAMAREVITIPLPRLEATAPKLETMAASLATMALELVAIALDLATTVPEVTTMHLLRLAAMVAPTLATILAITGTATAHRLVVEAVTVPTWQTNWTPG